MSAKTFDSQTAKFLAVVGENMPNISDVHMQRWIEHPKDLQHVLREALLPSETCELAPAPQPEPLIIPVGTTVVSPTTVPFAAKDHFVVNTKPSAPVRIASLWGDTAWFTEKVEYPFRGSTLKYGKLSRWSVDGPMIAELGGEEQAETTLTELFALMSAQPNGKSGPLLTDGRVNIFYIKDATGSLSAVHVRWHAIDGGWHVNASSVTYPCEWHDGSRVFFRDSR